MLKNLIKRSLAPWHTWRDDALEFTHTLKKFGTVELPVPKLRGQFDELSELYVSQLLRSLALSLINIFVPIYLYNLGFSIQTIFWFYVCWFAFRPFLDIITGLIIARIGPKHTMALGVFVQIFHFTMLLSLSGFSWPLWLVAITGGWAYGLFILAYEVNFSKVKHGAHGGKELGFAVIFERAGAIIGPLVGGIVAGLVGPEYTIGLAIIVLIGSLLPLLASKEPVRLNQEIHFEHFPIREHKRDLFVSAMLMLENLSAVILWPLFVAVAVLTVNTYASLGLITSVGAVASLLASYLIGKYADMGYGRQMLTVSTSIQAVIQLLKPFANSLGYAFAINVSTDLISSAYRIPFVKGMYDRADSLPGQRIVYLCYMSAANTAARFIFWTILWIMAQFIDPIMVIKIGFVFMALFTLGIQLEKFPSLRKRQPAV